MGIGGASDVSRLTVCWLGSWCECRLLQKIYRWISMSHLIFRFAKHLNPHHNVFAEQIVQVDRDKLYGESTTAEAHNGDYTEENESGSRMEGVVGPEGDRLGQLNAILEATFPHDPPTDESAPKKKKKTKKKQKKDLRESFYSLWSTNSNASVVFRLLPGSPKPISLDDPQHAARPLVRPSEDTEEEALQRARLISVSGVVCDWNDLMKEKAVAWPVVSIYRAIETHVKRFHFGMTTDSETLAGGSI